MMTDPNRQPGGIPTGGRYASQVHAETADLNLSGETSNRSQGVFSTDDLRSTQRGQAVAEAEQRIEHLGAAPIRNWFRIREARENLRQRKVNYEQQVGQASRDNDEWHRANPTAPEWAHKSTFFIDSLYKELRGFDVVAERKSGYSPGLELARTKLHYSKLSASDHDVLNAYFHKHEWNDCKDHSQPWSTYWQVQSQLHSVVTKIPPMKEAVTVWRGESYSTRQRSTSGDKQRTLDRIQHLMSLQPGDPFSWDSCAATSLSLQTAARKFSGSVLPESFKNLTPGQGQQDASHPVLFELETDRGVYIDDGLTQASHSNEDEILLPQNMEFEVVGHSQLSADRVDGNSYSSAYHLIKLRLR